MLTLSKRVLALVVGLFVFHNATVAQCPMPDNLDGGPCCTLTQPNLPKFPNFSQNSLEICWRDCNINLVQTVRAKWSLLPIMPVPSGPCEPQLVTLEIRNAAGTLLWSGRFRRQYSRTWGEVDGSGQAIQVYRFLVNGDLIPTTVAGPIPCPVPPCVPAFQNRARFTGYIDYAFYCGTGTFQESWMISHVCDFIDHAPGFPRAGAFHPNRSYTFVGPAAGFVPGPIQPTEGTPGSGFEDVRKINLPVPGTVVTTCDYEERINFNLNPINNFCLCSGAPTPQWMLGNLNLFGSCGTTITTPGVPYLPGFLSMGIGAWTIAGTYPGNEILRWNAGGYDYTDPCPLLTRREVFYGVTTLQGYTAFQVVSIGPGVILPLTFIDQGNSLTPPNGGTTIMNVPYVTDHILNLNHP